MLKADSIVIATGLKAENALGESLAGRFSQLYVIGDSQEPRNIMGAIWDGYEVGRAV
jgi:2-enoate reductase